MKTKIFLIALLTFAYFRPATAQEVLRINLADKANAHLFGPGKELSNQIIEGVKAGIIRPFKDAQLDERMDYEEFIEQLGSENEDVPFNREEFSRIELSKSADEKNSFYSLALIRSGKFTPSGEEKIIAYFLYREVAENVLKDNPACFDKEPKTGREMYYNEMLDRGLFKAE